MVKSITSPKKFIIGQNILENASEYTKVLGDSAFAICDEFILNEAKGKMTESFSAINHKVTFEKFGGECSKKEIQRLQELIHTSKSNVIIGIGGGKTLDTAKAVAYYENLPVVIIPTIASTDSPCTALSVIYTETGEFDEYLFLPSNPDVVLADTQILANAPTHFFVAGIGDALATYFEARACYQANGDNLVNMKVSQTGMGIAEMCYDMLLEYGVQATVAVNKNLVTKAVENVIEATIYLSGVGAESGGLAAAHAIHNGMTAINELHHVSHGEKVTFGLLAQLTLENAPLEEIEEVIYFCKEVGLPTTLEELGLENINEEDIMKVAELSCAEGDTMGNMPFDVTPQDVYNAILAANELSKQYQ
ncbi:glycerol dehydrogenase [Gottschalkia purinilytica]|uniref:Glycerol dehydrogenase n=1 Tax=Gottschalkia purinilytica TaxID=1503 RepID=A0A0L0WD53_GOTPU|nr:glycerol dehydrogenase [Gottschalkia purinilytica]KNF09397.1 glycerol dehydrogenase [Gottschalkia purinilytica]